MDLCRFTGIGAFGPAYQVMLEQDSHAPGSVDRVLASRMVRLCQETAGYLYDSFTPLELPYVKGTRVELERLLSETGSQFAESEGQLAAVVEFTRALGIHAEQDLSKMHLGGTEEEIIRRGSDWCTDVARVACVLCQIAGFPSRIVNLFDLSHAYCGHVIIEVYRGGEWGALDSSTGIVYRRMDGQPASVWELMQDADLIAAHCQDPRAFYTSVEQFQSAGIANYFCWDQERYDYTTSEVNEYYLSILEMSSRGWPGGLRWLYGEDEDVSDEARLPSGQARLRLSIT
jgi:hypothetical protein